LGAVPGIIDYDEPEPRRDRAGVASYCGLCSATYARGNRFGETAAAAAATVASECERLYAYNAATATASSSEVDGASDRDNSHGTAYGAWNPTSTAGASNVGVGTDADCASNIGFGTDADCASTCTAYADRASYCSRTVSVVGPRSLADFAASIAICVDGACACAVCESYGEATADHAERAAVGRHVQAVRT
jgi:hypothetical protein